MNLDNNIIGPCSSPETGEITAALAAAQAEYKAVELDASNPHFRSKFSSYATCCESLRGPLNKHGLALPDFRPGFFGGQWVLVGTLRHKGGQWISGMVPLLTGKADMQQLGAAMTYGKRMLLMALVGGFSGEPDDDGETVRAEAKAATPPANHAKTMSYESDAKTAITNAKSAEEAKRHLDTVRLRVREKAVPAEVYRRCEQWFDRVWVKKEVVQNG
jgi:hypothetical protein